MDETDDRNVGTPLVELEIQPKVAYMEKIVGISKKINMWPNTEKKNSFLFHLKIWIIIVLCLLTLLGFIAQIVNEFKNLDTIAVLVDLMTVSASATFRYIYIYVRGQKYVTLISLMHENFVYNSLFRKENSASMEKYRKLAKRLTLAYTTFTTYWVLQICTLPAITYVWKISVVNLNETEIIPYPVILRTYAPFDYDKQPWNAVFYVYQFITILTIAWIYVTVDCFWYAVILLAIGQFVMLKDSVDTIAEILKKRDSTEDFHRVNEIENRELHIALKHCIRHHQFTRQYVRLIEDINNPNIIVDCLHAVISIGFILLDLTIALNTWEWSNILLSFQYLIASIVHMYFFTRLGNELVVKEEELSQAIYEIPWYKWSSQKPFITLMIIQSRRPCRLTGGKMYNLSLEFFTSIMRTIFSSFTFLLQLMEAKKTK